VKGHKVSSAVSFLLLFRACLRYAAALLLLLLHSSGCWGGWWGGRVRQLPPALCGCLSIKWLSLCMVCWWSCAGGAVVPLATQSTSQLQDLVWGCWLVYVDVVLYHIRVYSRCFGVV
jgi:hypothetical protein